MYQQKNCLLSRFSPLREQVIDRMSAPHAWVDEEGNPQDVIDDLRSKLVNAVTLLEERDQVLPCHDFELHSLTLADRNFK